MNYLGLSLCTYLSNSNLQIESDDPIVKFDDMVVGPIAFEQPREFIFPLPAMKHNLNLTVKLSVEGGVLSEAKCSFSPG